MTHPGRPLPRFLATLAISAALVGMYPTVMWWLVEVWIWERSL